MTEIEAKGVLMAVSVVFSRNMQYVNTSTKGEHLITLILDNIIRDSCSDEVLKTFVSSFVEVLDNIKEKEMKIL